MIKMNSHSKYSRDIIKEKSKPLFLLHVNIHKRVQGWLVNMSSLNMYSLSSCYYNKICKMNVFFREQALPLMKYKFFFSPDEKNVIFIPNFECHLYFSSKDQQLQRLQARNNYTEEEAEQRINSQMSLDEKCSRATYVIDNSEDIENTRKQVFDLYRRFCGSYAHWKLRTLILSILVSGLGLGYFLLTRL